MRNVLEKFDSDTQAIVSWMDSATATEYAEMAPNVVDAAEIGDYHGRLIISHAAWHIEIMVRGLRVGRSANLSSGRSFGRSFVAH